MKWPISCTLHVAFKSVFRIRIALLRRPWADGQQICLKCYAVYRQRKTKESPFTTTDPCRIPLTKIVKKKNLLLCKILITPLGESRTRVRRVGELPRKSRWAD